MTKFTSDTLLPISIEVAMRANALSEITYLDNRYVLFDETTICPNEAANSIYRFINCGIRGDDESYVDQSCVVEVILSAESFKAAIEELHHTYKVQFGATYTVEFIGNDLRAKEADPHLIEK